MRAWINIEDKKPPEGVDVLLWVAEDWGAHEVGSYYADFYEEYFIPTNPDAKGREVTHWMPLPDPPDFDN